MLMMFKFTKNKVLNFVFGCYPLFLHNFSFRYHVGAMAPKGKVPRDVVRYHEMVLGATKSGIFLLVPLIGT